MEKKDLDKLVNLKFGESINLGTERNSAIMMRVPGGWIFTTMYSSGTGGLNTSACFVPYDINACNDIVSNRKIT